MHAALSPRCTKERWWTEAHTVPLLSLPLHHPTAGNARNAGGSAGAGAGPGYDKPWRKGMAGAGGPNAKGGPGGGPGQGQGGEGGGKKLNYVGPDAELAAMLERDVMDGAPGIR